MSDETVLTNAQVVLGDEVLRGSVKIRDGKIADVSSGAVAAGEDFGGDYLLPGLIELHTDHLEGHFAPRPKVRWNPFAAVVANDAQISSSGITTVFAAVRIGSVRGDTDFDLSDALLLIDAITKSAQTERLRSDHYLHVRCEVSTEHCTSDFVQIPNKERIGMVSLMDHAPGQRQFAKMEPYRVYYQGKLKMSDDVFDEFCARRIAESEKNSTKNREQISKLSRAQGIVLASHDDATIEHVEESLHYGVRVAEFPTTVEAARASHDNGLSVLMGAPNVMLGGSHSGNVSAAELAELGHLDILSSDYVPYSLMQAVFALSDQIESISLPDAVKLVSSNPAKAVGMDDRGRIESGLRADLVRVHQDENGPIVRSVWREGRRVA